METKEELYRQLTEWTVKEVNAQNALNELLPTEEGDDLPKFILTPDYIEEFKQAEKELNTATTKIRKIFEKLWQLSQ